MVGFWRTFHVFSAIAMTIWGVLLILIGLGWMEPLPDRNYLAPGLFLVGGAFVVLALPPEAR